MGTAMSAPREMLDIALDPAIQFGTQTGAAPAYSRPQTARRSKGRARSVRFDPDLVEYLFHKDLERVLENPRINQNKVILLETYLRVVRRNILPPAEIFENDKYIF